MNLTDAPVHTPNLPDLSTLFEFEDSRSGESFGVSLATLLQCLCVIEQRYIVPPFESEWEAQTIPPVLRAMATIGAEVTTR
ncbi:hypothetical protein RP726_05725 [Candidatus Methylospira mobilis]|uniref:hypothetical protein n=1 Tax=Candidatus Methylospira mobilis TaxID=1808979 RepID=UPI0028E26B28|nr:hypothetical protein [Candidatus Methylospira mobilis]WNV05911.1 hypothetical protein RP726_05725 [Candidatus Methylospira mobilis]